MRRFEYHFGRSNKFWEAEAVGGQARFAWGKVSIAGKHFERLQRQVKQFSSNLKANQYVIKKVLEKTRKGYVEVTEINSSIVDVRPTPPLNRQEINTLKETLLKNGSKKLKDYAKKKSIMTPEMIKKKAEKKMQEIHDEHQRDYIDGLA